MQTVDGTQIDRVLGENDVVAIDGANVTARFRRLGFRLAKPNETMTGAEYTDRLTPGQSALAYFDLVFSGTDEIPSASPGSRVSPRSC